MRFQPLLESAPGEFVGRSAEEAVDRARSVLGGDVKIRCWKTRRGGVLGFFAREVFVAGVKEPAGTSRAAARLAEPPIGDVGVDAMAPTLDELVASTSDEVSFGAQDTAGEDHAFRDVLAQAEAALNDAVFDDAAWLAEEVATATAIVAASDTPQHELNEFRVSLESLGLPTAYRPSGYEGVLDGLVRSLTSLPSPRALPTSPGSVIAIVGSRRDARAVAQEVAALLDLDEPDVIVSSDDPAVRRRIARRKRSARVSVVVLEAPVRGRTFDSARDELERMAPDYVLGVVAATLKCADVDRWRSELRIDALALRRWDETETPAELLAALPVYSVDGAVMSTMRWVSLLLSTFVDRTDATA
ncbi:MAG TPA: hypothetical protein VGG17_00100 [Acidimicrobiales bacterium]